MRKCAVLIVVLGLLSSPSIAEEGSEGKSMLSAPRHSALTRARVRVVSRARGTKGPDVNVLLPSSRALLPVVNQPDIHPSDRVFLDRILRAVPATCRSNIEHLVVRYPSTSLRASDIERGQATASTMILRGPLASIPPKEQAEMTGVIFHECGHIVDLGALEGSPHSGKSAYPDGHVPTYNDDPSRLFYEISWRNVASVRPEAREADFVSGYAQADPFEDIAESLVYYALHEGAFRERARENPVLARKLQWMETYVFTEKHAPLASEAWDGTIAWDVTKLKLSDLSVLALSSTNAANEAP